MKNFMNFVLAALCMTTLPVSIIGAPCMGCFEQCVPSFNDLDNAAVAAATGIEQITNFNNLQLINITSAKCQLVNGVNYMLDLTFRQCLPSQKECTNFLQCSVEVSATLNKQFKLTSHECGDIYHVSPIETTPEVTTEETASTGMIFKTTTTVPESSSISEEAISKATNEISATSEPMTTTFEIATTIHYATSEIIMPEAISESAFFTTDAIIYGETSSSSPSSSSSSFSSSSESIYDPEFSTTDGSYYYETSFSTESASEITTPYSTYPETSFEMGSTPSATSLSFKTDSSDIGTGTTEQQIKIDYRPRLSDDSETNCNGRMGCPKQCNETDLESNVMLRAINFLSIRMGFPTVQLCNIESAECQVVSGTKYNLNMTLYGIRCNIDGFDAICEQEAMTCTNVQFYNEPRVNIFSIEKTYDCSMLQKPVPA